MAKPKKKPPGPPARVTVLSFAILRMILLAACAIAGAVYAVVRYYTHPPAPMMVPAPSATEIPVEVEEKD
jgi:hypothetical protein